jgi:hypothetical protein
VSLNDALGFLARRPVGLAAGLVLAAVCGCGYYSPTTINDILDAQIRQLTGVAPTDTSQIQLVNQTQNTIELDVLIDGLLTTITCTPTNQQVTYTPLVCPLTVEVVQERRFNDKGAFVGGREYNHNPAFVFTETEFDCQSVIMFTFTEDQTTPAVL